MLLKGVAIFHAQRPDDPAPLVRKQGVLNSVTVGKLLEGVARVVANREDRDPLPLVIGSCLLQLDELRATERSPKGAALEDDERATITPDLVQINGEPVLIRQDDVGKAFSELRTDHREVEHGPDDLCH